MIRIHVASGCPRKHFYDSVDGGEVVSSFVDACGDWEAAVINGQVRSRRETHFFLWYDHCSSYRLGRVACGNEAHDETCADCCGRTFC